MAEYFKWPINKQPILNSFQKLTKTLESNYARKLATLNLQSCYQLYHSELGFLLFQNIFLLLQWFFIQLETSLYFIQPEVKPEVRL